MHEETHAVTRIGWLRAAILGANDGIVSTASLIAGVAAAGATQSSILVTGTAGLVAGAMSMAAGEYVSVSSQADTEAADRAREEEELATQPQAERAELITIYEKRGLDTTLATQVADQLASKGALQAHLRDELGLIETHAAQPVLAAVSSAAAFTVGALLPLLTVLIAPANQLVWAVTIASLLFLALLGAIGAKVGGANILRAVARVTFWRAFAMAATAAIGALFGTQVA